MAETQHSAAAQCPFPETPEAVERWTTRTMTGGRVEIDTSPPFRSVKEAVSHFEGRALWNWISLHMLHQQGRDACKVYDISTMGEQAAELEKDLAEKEQKTLHVLRELERAKKMVEELKFKLRKQVSTECMSTADLLPNFDHISRPSAVRMSITSPEIVTPRGYREGGCSSPFNCGSTSPKLIVAELKQTKMNLSRTTNELAVIRASVQSLNEQMLKEKLSMRDTHEKCASSSVGFVSPLRVEVGARSPSPEMALHDAETRGSLPNLANISMELRQLNLAAEQFIRMAEAAKCEVLRAMSEIEQTKAGLETAEMRWFAAKKMEEAAMAVEAVAIAESKDLSNNGRNSSAAVPNGWLDDGITLSFQEYSLLTHKARKAEELSEKILMMGHIDEANNNSSKLTMLKKLGRATQEVELSRGALEEALDRVDVANLNTTATFNAKENLQRCWEQESSQRTLPNRIPTRLKNYVNNAENRYVNRSKMLNHDSKPVLRPSIALRDVVGQKQVSPEGVGVRNNQRDPVDGQAVPLSEMLRLQRDVMLAAPGSHRRRNGIDDQKHFFAQRKRFGFIHFSLPLTKQGRKKKEASNSNPASHGE